MSKGDFDGISWSEVLGATAMCASVGMIRALYMIRRGRKFRAFDFLLEPCLAVVGGMCMWGLIEVTSAPDSVQAVMTSLGAWGGPKTIQWLELRYLGGRRKTDSKGDEDA